MTNNLNLLYENDDVFGGFFNELRVKRAQKLKSIFGLDWFKDKKILELGCAYGNIGFYFQSLGADITFSDARQELLNVVKTKDANAKTILIDQNNDWDLTEKYDLIIHFGILYNLNNWERDLKKTVNHAHYVALESAVNIFANEIEFKIKNDSYDYEQRGPYKSIGTLPSSSLIEKNLNNLRVEYKRYDDEDLNLNSKSFQYNIVPSVKFLPFPNISYHINTWSDEVICGGRKFWIIKNGK